MRGIKLLCAIYSFQRKGGIRFQPQHVNLKNFIAIIHGSSPHHYLRTLLAKEEWKSLEAAESLGGNLVLVASQEVKFSKCQEPH